MQKNFDKLASYASVFQICMANSIPDDGFFVGEDIIIHANLNRKCEDPDMRFAISDGGADSCILGKGVSVIRTSGRYARLQGYDSTAAASRRVEIVTGVFKTVDTAGSFIIYKIHEAPHLPESETTLLSEYQMRDHGIIVDSCASTHLLSLNPETYGTQQISCQYNGDTHHSSLINRGGTMGLPMYQIKDGDMDNLPVIEVTSSTPWIPSRHRQIYNATTMPSVVGFAPPATVDAPVAEAGSAPSVSVVDPPATVDAPIAEVSFAPSVPVEDPSATVNAPDARVDFAPSVLDEDPSAMVDAPDARVDCDPSVPVEDPSVTVDAPDARVDCDPSVPAEDPSATVDAPVAEVGCDSFVPVEAPSATVDAPVTQVGCDPSVPVEAPSATVDAPVAKVGCDPSVPVEDTSATVDAPVAQVGRDPFVPVGDPSATVDDPFVQVGSTPSVPVDAPSATVDASFVQVGSTPSVPVEAPSATVETPFVQVGPTPSDLVEAPVQVDSVPTVQVDSVPVTALLLSLLTLSLSSRLLLSSRRNSGDPSPVRQQILTALKNSTLLLTVQLVQSHYHYRDSNTENAMTHRRI